MPIIEKINNYTINRVGEWCPKTHTNSRRPCQGKPKGGWVVGMGLWIQYDDSAGEYCSHWCCLLLLLLSWLERKKKDPYNECSWRPSNHRVASRHHRASCKSFGTQSRVPYFRTHDRIASRQPQVDPIIYHAYYCVFNILGKSLSPYIKIWWGA